MAEEITNAIEMAEGEEIRSATKRRCFDVSFKLKVLEEDKIPHEIVRKKRGGGRRAVIVRMPVLSWPFLINIAFTLI